MQTSSLIKSALANTDVLRIVQEQIAVADVASIVSRYALDALVFEAKMLDISATKRIELNDCDLYDKWRQKLEDEMFRNADALNIIGQLGFLRKIENAFYITNVRSCQRYRCYFYHCSCGSPWLLPVQLRLQP